MLKPNNPELKSFVKVSSDSHFPIQNLPYGVFRKKTWQKAHVGVAIGEQILDLTACENEGLLKHSKDLFGEQSLNNFMAQKPEVWKSVRENISELLRHDNNTLQSRSDLNVKFLHAQADVSMCLPASIGDYTDFYSSIEHASNVGAMFRDKNNPLLPNWLHLPVGYHGRASSVVAGDLEVRRPWGQILEEDPQQPIFSPCRRLDFELEMAFFVGQSNKLGERISIENAHEHIFGMVLMNDWSARDIQKWEYQPLGPFVSKSFATSISPWVVPMEALEPFAVESPKQDPLPLEYLRKSNKKPSHFDIHLEVDLKTEKSKSAENICKTNAKLLYWSMEQQLTHHTVTGCNTKPGDLMASGTISGSKEDAYGSLLELSMGGKKPLNLKSGEQRKFLEDYDELIMSGYCKGQGYKIGFGALKGKVLPAVEM